ncbi:hypothetical protein LTR10_004702 [Elasticomyces elasticus]|uniref:Uncharacterized protein n=1 Tax=Elasticomyces elasticus TaxID=574655 RepID=A0AAN7W8P5_9PEZI|nr:hypothetical protein LTR10_004702 [Elasticomyces elasticus]KAK5701735.1 hypothetical protein LTR97_004553 [Elasticomyces elasticus]KAK5724640.1 hypothetical protein LTR15_004686 [Elasticomyces elasticus]
MGSNQVYAPYDVLEGQKLADVVERQKLADAALDDDLPLAMGEMDFEETLTGMGFDFGEVSGLLSLGSA